MSKRIRAIEKEVGLGDRENMVFSGTAVTYGQGPAVVTATGMQTEMGRIAGLLSGRAGRDHAVAEGARPGRRQLESRSSSSPP